MSRLMVGLVGAFVVFFGAQAFVAPAGRASGLRGAAQRTVTGQSAVADASSTSTAALALGAAAAAIALGAASLRRSTRSTRTQTNAHWCTANNPVYVYVNALIELAKQQNESVQVAKDILHWKREMWDKDLADRTAINEIYLDVSLDELQRARKIVEVFQPKSKVLASFVVLLGKKKRLNMLREVINVFVRELYELQGIAPVRVISADKLGKEEETTIKDKMKAMLGKKDIKMVTKVDETLLGGFKVEYDFSDPELMAGEYSVLDCSLERALSKASAAIQL